MQSGIPRGEIFVISAPSGTGKTTLCRRVCGEVDGLVYSVSHTTRVRRSGEVEGRDYFFVSEPVFRSMSERGEFLEWAQVYGHCYGTSRKWVESQLERGLDVIMDVDAQGAQLLRSAHVRTHQIFVLPPSWEALTERLSGRGTDSLREMRIRLQWAKEELKAWEKFDYVVFNGDLDVAVRDLASIILSQRCRMERVKPWIDGQSGRWVRSEG
jgi:guanylate kinase